jgi:hypothetical protein
VGLVQCPQTDQANQFISLVEPGNIKLIKYWGWFGCSNLRLTGLLCMLAPCWMRLLTLELVPVECFLVWWWDLCLLCIRLVGRITKCKLLYSKRLWFSMFFESFISIESLR